MATYTEGSTIISPRGDIYVIHELVARGGFSTVYTAHIHPSRSRTYAVKVIDKRRLAEKTPNEQKRQSIMNSLEREATISMQVDHPFILKTKEVINTPTQWSSIMDYIEGGELFEILRTCGIPSLRQNISILTQICEAVKYLHEMNICHRDIKPENILCTSFEEPFDVKLADFGLALNFQNEVMDSPCGTVNYAAPEVIRNKGRYTEMCDMWSIGVLAFVILTVSFPFQGRTADEIKRNVLAHKIDWVTFEKRERCEDALDFVKRLLVEDPAKRMTAEMCLEHPFLHLLDVEEDIDIDIPLEMIEQCDF